MQSKNAIGNLVNRYKAVLKKCNIMNTFGSLAIAGMLVMGGASPASALFITNWPVPEFLQDGTLDQERVDDDDTTFEDEYAAANGDSSNLAPKFNFVSDKYGDVLETDAKAFTKIDDGNEYLTDATDGTILTYPADNVLHAGQKIPYTPDNAKLYGIYDASLYVYEANEDGTAGDDDGSKLNESFFAAPAGATQAQSGGTGTADITIASNMFVQMPVGDPSGLGFFEPADLKLTTEGAIIIDGKLTLLALPALPAITPSATPTIIAPADQDVTLKLANHFTAGSVTLSGLGVPVVLSGDGSRALLDIGQYTLTTTDDAGVNIGTAGTVLLGNGGEIDGNVTIKGTALAVEILGTAADLTGNLDITALSNATIDGNLTLESGGYLNLAAGNPNEKTTLDITGDLITTSDAGAAIPLNGGESHTFKKNTHLIIGETWKVGAVEDLNVASAEVTVAKVMSVGDDDHKLTVSAGILNLKSNDIWQNVTITDGKAASGAIVLIDTGILRAGNVTFAGGTHNTGGTLVADGIELQDISDGIFTLGGHVSDTTGITIRAEEGIDSDAFNNITELNLGKNGTLTIGELGNVSAEIPPSKGTVIFDHTIKTTDGIAGQESTVNLIAETTLDITNLAIGGASITTGNGTLIADTISIANGQSLTIGNKAVSVDTIILGTEDGASANFTLADANATVTVGAFTVANGADTIDVTAGTLDLKALTQADLTNTFKATTSVTGGDAFITVGDYSTTADKFVTAAVADSIAIGAGGTFQANKLTLNATDNALNIATTGKIKANTLVLSGGETTIKSGTVEVSNSIQATKITLKHASDSDLAVLSLVDSGSTTVDITASHGTINVKGSADAQATWKVGNITLGAFVENGGAANDTIGKLNLDNANLNMDALTFVSADKASLVDLDNNSTLTVASLRITGLNTIEVDNGSTLVVNGAFESAKTTSLTLAGNSTLEINSSELFKDGNALQDTINKITATDGMGTVYLKGGTTYNLTGLGGLRDTIFVGDSGFVKVEAGKIKFATDELATVGGTTHGVKHDRITTDDITGIDITNQSHTKVAIGSTELATAVGGFIANGVVVYDTAAVPAAATTLALASTVRDANAPVMFKGTTELQGNDIITYKDANGTSSTITGVIQVGEGDKNTVATLSLTNADNGHLTSVTLDAGSAAATLNLNGVYTIGTVTGDALATDKLNVLGGDIKITTLTKVALDAETHGFIELGSVDGATLTLGHAAAARDAGGLFKTSEIVSTSVGEFDGSANELTLDNGAMFAFGKTADNETVSNRWVASVLEDAKIEFGTGDGMVSQAFGIYSALDADEVAIKVGTGAIATEGTLDNPYFGSDSVLVVSDAGIDAGVALTGKTINAVAGAKLIITDVVLDTDGKGSVIIAKNDDDGETISSVEAGAWGKGENSGDTLFFDSAFYTGKSDYSNDQSLIVKIWQVYTKDILPVVDSALGTLIDKIDRNGVITSSGVKFIDNASKLMENNGISAKETGAIIEGATKLAAVAGVTNIMTNITSAASTNVANRTTLASNVTSIAAMNFDGDASNLVAMADGANGMTNGIGLWAQPMYQQTSASGFESGNFEYGFDSDFAGVSVGSDYTFDNSLRVGAAFHVGSGSSDSTGDFTEANNDFDYLGFSLYTGYHFGNFGISADLGYTNTSNEVSQTSLAGNVKADFDADVISFGVLGEYAFATPLVDTVAYIGARVNHISVDNYTTMHQNSAAFKTDSMDATVFTFPVGVTLSKDIATANGWNIAPSIDLGVQFAAGDLDQTQDVRITGVNGVASMESEVADAVTFRGGLGLNVTKDQFSFDLDYKLDASSNITSHGVSGTFRYNF